MLFGKMLRCPYAHCKVVSIDISAAEKMPGVKAIEIVQKAGSTIHWAGDEIVAVAAVDEPTAEDAVRAIQVKYQKLSAPGHRYRASTGIRRRARPDQHGRYRRHARQPGARASRSSTNCSSTASLQAQRRRLLKGRKTMAQRTRCWTPSEGSGCIPRPGAEPKSNYQKAAAQTLGDLDKAFSEAEVVSEGLYGVPVITHCCMEAHGSISEWTDADHLFVHISTQNVSGIAGQMAEPLKIPASQYSRAPGPRRRRFWQQVLRRTAGESLPRSSPRKPAANRYA